MPIFLHVGCGPNRKENTTPGFNTPEWTELRLDINPQVNPDIIGTMLDMSAIDEKSVDAVFSSHNIEHVYAHEVPLVLKEFLRVLKPEGFLVVTCPDLRPVAKLITEDKLTEPAYISRAGPISPIDILYGHRAQLAQGNHYMAHKCGFTLKVLIATLQASGFQTIASIEREPAFDLWAVACKSAVDKEVIQELAARMLPG